MADAVTLGKRFGADVQSVEFWRSSQDMIRMLIGVFEQFTAHWRPGGRLSLIVRIH